MGIFDIFTGGPAKAAAGENKALLNSNLKEGWDTLNNAQTYSLGALDKAGGYYEPLSQKYGSGTNLYLDSLGVNGPEGNTRATSAFQAGPGYQYMVDQSLDQAKRAAAASGIGLGGGNTLAALSDRAGNLANQEYGGWQNRLAGLISPELQSVGGQAGAQAGKAGVYQNTANNLTNLYTGITNKIADQNTQAANAEMAGSGNLWGLGLSAGKLLAGGGGLGSLWSGATSLLGGIAGPSSAGQPWSNYEGPVRG